jgi:hypothetical protein
MRSSCAQSRALRSSKTVAWAIALIAAISVVVGCASNLPKSSQMRQISIGMSKGEVVSGLGEPTVARGSIRNKFNQTIDVWEYTLTMPSKDSVGQVAGKVMITLITFGVGAALFTQEKKDYWL